MEKIYMVCDYVGANCKGRLIHENGSTIGFHYSSSYNWLRFDLLKNLKNPEKYEIIDLIGQPVPERFQNKA